MGERGYRDSQENDSIKNLKQFKGAEVHGNDYRGVKW